MRQDKKENNLRPFALSGKQIWRLGEVLKQRVSAKGALKSLRGHRGRSLPGSPGALYNLATSSTLQGSEIFQGEVSVWPRDLGHGLEDNFGLFLGRRVKDLGDFLLIF